MSSDAGTTFGTDQQSPTTPTTANPNRTRL